MYFITDLSRANWPGRLPYRSPGRSSRGYPTREAAYARLQVVQAHYNARFGCSPGDLRVIEQALKPSESR